MRHELRWYEGVADAARDLQGARARAERVVSFCAFEAGGALACAAVWRGAEGAPELRFEPDLPLTRADAVLARHAREGFHPALVAMLGPARLCFVLERTPEGERPPAFIPPGPLRAAALEEAALRCVAAAGAPRDEDGGGLLVAAIRAPAGARPIASALRLDRLPPGLPFREHPATRALEAAARPVQALPLPGEDGALWVLSLWQDDVLEPWPEPDPFAPARRFQADEATSAAALGGAAARRRAREDRRVLSLGAGPGPRFIALYGAPGRDDPLPRRPRVAAAGEPPAHTAEHPLDRWAMEQMRATGARHGQMVVVRGRRLAHAAAYTLAEAGYPAADLDHALRIGSLSKALTALALLRAVEGAALPAGLDTAVADLLGSPPGAGPPALHRVSLRHLLTHRAGLRTSLAIHPDAPGNPLAEHRITALLAGSPGPARPGQLGAALSAMPDDRAFAGPPGTEDYSNEGFVLLGEILARLVHGRDDAYERAVADTLLRPAGVDPGARGCLLGAGAARARARRESPAHPERPALAAARFPGDGPLVLSPYALNGPFLGGAAGWCVPLLWIARVLQALASPRGMADAQTAATPAAPGSTTGHGLHLGAPGFWTFGGRSARVRRLFHAGRVEGGAALLLHLSPLDPDEDPDLSLGVVVAMNKLVPLREEPQGRELLSILRGLERAPGWAERDRFPLP